MFTHMGSRDTAFAANRNGSSHEGRGCSPTWDQETLRTEMGCPMRDEDVHPHGIKRHCICSDRPDPETTSTHHYSMGASFPECSPCCCSPPQVRVHPDQHHTNTSIFIAWIKKALCFKGVKHRVKY